MPTDCDVEEWGLCDNLRGAERVRVKGQGGNRRKRSDDSFQEGGGKGG